MKQVIFYNITKAPPIPAHSPRSSPAPWRVYTWLPSFLPTSAWCTSTCCWALIWRLAECSLRSSRQSHQALWSESYSATRTLPPCPVPWPLWKYPSCTCHPESSRRSPWSLLSPGRSTSSLRQGISSGSLGPPGMLRCTTPRTCSV